MIVHTESRWVSLEEGEPILTEKMAVCQLEDGNKSGAISGRMTTTMAIHMLHNVPAPVRAIRETVRRSAKGIRETGPCNAIAHTETSLRSFTSFTYFQRPKLFLLFATHTHTHPQTRSGTQSVLQTQESQNSIISKTYNSSPLFLLFTTRFDRRSHKPTNSSIDLQPKCPSNPKIQKSNNLQTHKSFNLFSAIHFCLLFLSTWNPNVLEA